MSLPRLMRGALVRPSDGSPRALTGRVRVGAGQVLASMTSLTVSGAVGGQSTLTATLETR